MPEITVDSYGDLVSDDDLDLVDADTLASVLPTRDGKIAFWLPSWISEEKPLEPAGQSDHVYLAEVLPERATEKAYYVNQGPASAWIPKSVARVYRAASDARIISPQTSITETSGGDVE